MNSILKKYIKGDYVVWFVFIALSVLSSLEMFSASSVLAYKATSHIIPVIKHIMFLGIGALVVVLVHLINYKYIRSVAYLGLIFSWLLLIYALLRGVTLNDAARWINFFGFQFQPSELAKISLIIVVADLIDRSQNPENKETKNWFLYIVVASGITCLLILFENFSTAFLLFCTVLLMMFIGKIPFKKIAALLLVMVLFSAAGFGFTKVVPKEKMPKLFDRAYTWVNRIDSFFVEDIDSKYVITDENRQVVHGQIAVARGGLFGVMPGKSVERDFLPGAYSDFIYSIIVEELGLIGGFFIIALYLILLYRAGRISWKCTTVYPAILVIGLTLMLVLQAFVSMSVSVHLGPVTGQPLPLISRGGTSILVSCAYFGVILSVTRYINGEEFKSMESENINGEENENKSEIPD